MRTPATDVVREDNLSKPPMVDLLGDARERSLKAQKKQTNLSVLWSPHRIYDGKKINCWVSDDRVKLVAPDMEIG